jgi:hypothetical protein
MMTIPEILQELEPYTGRFPMDAMRAGRQAAAGKWPTSAPSVKDPTPHPY